MFWYILKEMIYKIRWDVFGFEGFSNTFFYFRYSCVFFRFVFLFCVFVGLCCWCFFIGRGFKRVLLWWLGYFLCLGFVVILFSWVYFESLVGYNKWVRKSLGF